MKVTQGSAAYEAAYHVNNAAIAVYNKAQAAYRTMAIGDDEFIAARVVYKAAMDAYDAIHAKEAA